MAKVTQAPSAVAIAVGPSILTLRELTKQFPEVLSVWENLDVSKVEAVANAYLRVKPNQTISTKTAVEGPIEIVLVARTAKTPPTFEFLLPRNPFSRGKSTWPD
jgi:hypothetical protein